MSANEPRKRVSYRYINCPHCGNEVMAKSVDEEQKCGFCKRKYEVIFSGHGKKTFWEPVAIDYSYDRERNGVFNERKHKGKNPQTPRTK